MRPLVGKYRLRNREDFYSHPACLGQVFALLLHVLVRPAEHFNNSAFLAALVNCRLVHIDCLPNEIDWLLSNGELLAVIVGGLHCKGECVGSEGASSGKSA